MERVEHLERLGSEEVQRLMLDDRALVDQANQLRLALASSPSQSNFRVIALLVLHHTPQAAAGAPLYAILCGSNAEPGNISGSICAERAALCRMRFLVKPVLLKVVVVTDSPRAISPGALCREFLASHADLETPVVMGSADGQLVRCLLGDLVPFPYKYRLQTRQSILSFAQSCGSLVRPSQRKKDPESEPEAGTLPVADSSGTSRNTTSDESFTVDELTVDDELASTAMNAAMSVNHLDQGDGLYPIRLSAAVIYSDGQTLTAWQMKGLEYGCTADPVVQLVHRMESLKVQNPASEATPVAIVMVDQFGVLHAPFAQARSQLVERGYGHLTCLIHKIDGTMAGVKCDDLLPSPRSEDGTGCMLLSHDDFK